MVAHARIVFVKSRSHLQNSMGHDCRYRTADGHSLVPGYWYVASWPDEVDEPLFDAKARYAGPYDSEEEAASTLDGSSIPPRGVPVAARGDLDSRRLTDIAYVPDWHCPI